MKPAQNAETRPTGKKPLPKTRNLSDNKKLLDACSCTEQDAFRFLDTGLSGLSIEQAAARLASVGPNIPASAKRPSIIEDIYQRAKDPLVIQLLIIAAVSLIMGDVRSAVVVGLMLALSVVLAYVQEQRSIRAADQLKKLVQTSAVVVRNGKELDIQLADVVPGDLVLLAAGAIIPADIRLVSAKDFFVNQSSMTGESMPVEKVVAPSPTPLTEALDLPNGCRAGRRRRARIALARSRAATRGDIRAVPFLRNSEARS